MINKKSAKKKKVCIISFSNIGSDIRVQREIEMARKHFEITVIGYGDWEPPGNVRYVQMRRTPRTKKYLFSYALGLILARFFPKLYDTTYWQKKEYETARVLLEEGDFDLVHANDWDTLPLSVKAAEKSNFRLLFDAHEFSPEQETDKFLGKIFIKPYRHFLFNKYLNNTDTVITVSPGIQDLLMNHYGIKSELIMNACFYKQYPFSSIDKNKISIIHHGIAVKGRRIEDMIRVIALVKDRFTLYLMLVERSDKKYIPYLKKLAGNIAPGRVVFLSPVDPEKVLDAVSAYDIGLPLLSASQLSYLNALPNKFFHYIMTGLAIVVPPLPAMAEIVEREGIGCVAESIDIEAVANLLNQLDLNKIDGYKRRSLELAKRMNAEVEMNKLLTIYQKLLAIGSN